MEVKRVDQMKKWVEKPFYTFQTPRDMVRKNALLLQYTILLATILSQKRFQIKITLCINKILEGLVILND